HLPARVPVQRAARRGRGAAVGRVLARGGTRPGARAARAGRGEGAGPSREPGGAEGGRRGERSRRREERNADAGLPFGLSSYCRVGWVSPLRGDGSLAMPRVYIETYGCQMNVSDSELMFGVLARVGYVRTFDLALADWLLVISWTVRDAADLTVV